MPYRSEQFVNGEIYHIVTRGIDDNLLFKDINDYYRGIFSIYEFNNSNPVEIFRRRNEIRSFKNRSKKVCGDPSSTQTCGARVSTQSFKMEDKRDLMVEILCFAFMPNHIHLLVRQIKENGIVRFMQKLGGGYGRYFNEKYERKGYVFQNRFVSIPVKSNEQLMTVFVYIHVNPTSINEPKYKEIGIKNPDQVIKFLGDEYRWSSYFDYIGKQNFPSVTNREFMLNVMGGEQSCKKSVEDWVRFKGEMREFPDLVLE